MPEKSHHEAFFLLARVSPTNRFLFQAVSLRTSRIIMRCRVGFLWHLGRLLWFFQVHCWLGIGWLILILWFNWLLDLSIHLAVVDFLLVEAMCIVEKIGKQKHKFVEKIGVRWAISRWSTSIEQVGSVPNSNCVAGNDEDLCQAIYIVNRSD